MKRNVRIISLVLALAFVIAHVSACSENKKRNIDKDNVTTKAEELKDSEIFVVMAGDEEIYLDEVRYYAYNTQATYEVYYKTMDKTLDWNGQVEEGVSMEKAAKSIVLDGICERVAFCEYAEENDIVLTSDEKDAVKEKVNTFYMDTNKNLLDKMNVGKDRISDIFERYELAKKVKNILEEKQSGKSEEVYKNWKIENTVTTNVYWEEINYQTPIFEKK